MRISRRVLQPLVTPSSAPQGPFCTYCQRNLATLTVVVRCAHHRCNNRPFCFECFSVGADDRDPHLATHPFRYISKLSLSQPLYHPEWTIHQEFRLLHAMLEYGFGHWKQIADYVGKGMQKCQNHYLSVYLQSETILPSPLPTSPTRASNTSTTPVSESQPPAPPPRLTHLPLRADFEFEWDDPAEDVVADLHIPTERSEQELDSALEHLYAFDARLHRRGMVKEYILEPPVLQVSDDDPQCLRNEHMLSDRICVLACLLVDDVFQSFYDAVMLEFRKARSVFRAARRQTAQLHASQSQLKPNPSLSKSNASSKRRRSGKARSTPFSKRKRSSAKQERPQSPLGDVTMPNTPDSQPMSPNHVFSPSWSHAFEPCVQPSPALLQKAKRLRLLATTPNPPPPWEPKQIEDMEDACKLTTAEKNLCAVLHIAPRDFLEMKTVMLSTVARQMRRRNAKQSATPEKISADNPPRRLAGLSDEKKQLSSPDNAGNGNPSLTPPALTLPDAKDHFIPNSAHFIEEPKALPVTQLGPSIRFDRMLFNSFRNVPKPVPTCSLTSTPDAGDAESNEHKKSGRITCKSRLLPPSSDTQLNVDTLKAMCVEDPASSHGIATLVISNGEGKQPSCEHPVPYSSNAAIMRAVRRLPGEPSRIYLKLRLRPPRSYGTRTARRESRVKRIAGKRNGGLPAHATRLGASNELAATNLNVEGSDGAGDRRINQVDSVALEEQLSSHRSTLAVQRETDPTEATYKGSADATSIDEGFTASGVRACNFRSEKFESSFSARVSEAVGIVTATDSNVMNDKTTGSATHPHGIPSCETKLSSPEEKVSTAMVAHPLTLQADLEHASNEETAENQHARANWQAMRSENTKLSCGRGPIEGGALDGDELGRVASVATLNGPWNGGEQLANSSWIDATNEVKATRLTSLNVVRATPERNSAPHGLKMQVPSNSLLGTGLVSGDHQTSHLVTPSTTSRPVDPANDNSNQLCSEVNGNGHVTSAVDDEGAVTVPHSLTKSCSLSESGEENAAHCVGNGECEVIKEFVHDWGKSNAVDLSNDGTSGAVQSSAHSYWGTSKPAVMDSRGVDDHVEVKSVRPTRERVRRASAMGKTYQESSETSDCPDSNSEGPISILEQGSGEEDAEQEYRGPSKRTLRPRKPTRQSTALAPTRRSTRIQKRSRRLLDYSPEPYSRAPKRRRVGSSGSGKGSYEASEVLSEDNEELDEYVPNSSKPTRKRANKGCRGKSTKGRTPSARRASGRRASRARETTTGVEIITPQSLCPRSCTISSDSNSSGPGTTEIYASTSPDLTRKRYALRKKSTA
ncbi:Transcriptional adapter 2-beta [Gracilariopsis chorda]|uniref:Transcriptional adapter 2-beta n=1 Tax=Gracilariopsis chorda TaxID=448386 RepID=A0A2V3IZW8_9FLOR|nr:Transcriptional adapter 2-beta [Gracilariopsis chorda]|eukprot:PXF47227.1 Transcriptional adapter 2-beta [Gracilariopsis chorda]